MNTFLSVSFLGCVPSAKVHSYQRASCPTVPADGSPTRRNASWISFRFANFFDALQDDARARQGRQRMFIPAILCSSAAQRGSGAQNFARIEL
jgi:hypothetical protein